MKLFSAAVLGVLLAGKANSAASGFTQARQGTSYEVLRTIRGIRALNRWYEALRLSITSLISLLCQ